MKKVLFATTAASTLMLGGIASAQGIALFGDARLGLGYNIDNDGGVLIETDDDGNIATPDDLRAVSRVRFGVNMTGETDSGITFGATIRADNAVGGEGGARRRPDRRLGLRVGQLRHPDLRRHQRCRRAVGRRRSGQLLADRPRRLRRDAVRLERRRLRLGRRHHFSDNPFARPTVRYDFDIMGFGISVSSNRDLTDIGVGAGYAADFGGGSWSLGVGYYKFDEFAQISEGDLVAVPDAARAAS